MSSEGRDGWIERITERASFLHRSLTLPALEQYRGQPWPLLTALEEFAREHDIPMLFKQNKMEIVRKVLAQQDPKPKMVVEFGTYVGNSAVGWAATLRDLHGGSDGTENLHVYTFEADPEIAQCARDLAKLAGVEDLVTVVHGPGSESLKRLCTEGKIKKGGVDMVFIDHWEKYYLPDLQLCEQLKLFHVGSVACADNTDFPGAPAYKKYVQSGGSGEPGALQFESKSYKADSQGGAVRPTRLYRYKLKTSTAGQITLLTAVADGGRSQHGDQNLA